MKKLALSALALVSVIAVIAQQGPTPFKMPKSVTSEWYKPNTVIVKLKPEMRNLASKNNVAHDQFNEFLSKIGAVDFEKMFPAKMAPVQERNAQGLEMVDLSLVYEFKYNTNAPIEKVLNSILSMGIAEYAEPHYIHKPCYTPNDGSIGLQWHLGNINAYNAWNTSKGDTNVVIGIVDSGYDMNHPDLNDKIKKNYADPINGNDDDGDGYTDNFNGWDLFGSDNNPQYGGSDHGVHVSGCAAPETDNSIGVAGPGFDCMLLPIKAGDGATIDFGYQGIQLAADMGADVINCSWGGPGGGSFGQDIIDYATINQDALVVAAAGNDGTEGEFFPGYFNYVINIASTDSDNGKSNFSNYGIGVDVSAPGNGIYATLGPSTYGYNSGTSMASPVAAGAAGLIKSAYPFLNAIQVGEQLKASAWDHYGVAGNGVYQGKLGTGRIDLGNAMGGITVPSVVMTDRTVTDNNDDAIVIGDTIRIFGDYTNYLAPTGNLIATLTANSGNVNIIDNNSTIGVVSTLVTKDNNADPFEVIVLPSAPQNESVQFTINLDDGNYSTNVVFNVTINVDYVNITINDVHTTITSKSLIGFNDFSTQLEGLGFKYVPGSFVNLLFDGGLMVGVPGEAMDNVRDDQGGTDTDFGSSQNVQEIPPTTAEFETFGIFNDNPAGGNKIGLEVRHNSYAWSTPGNTKYVIVEYSIKNTSGGALSNVYAGIFCDWDIQNYADNMADQDVPRKLGYCYSTTLGGFYAGVRVVSATPFNNYSIQNDGGNGGMDIYDGYTDAEKYTSLSTSFPQAGMQDVSQVVSTGPFNLSNGDSTIVAFALVAGDDLADLEQSSDSAEAIYEDPTAVKDITFAKSVVLGQNYPNPATDMTNIGYYLPESGNVTMELVDITGKKVMQVLNTDKPAGGHVATIDLTNLGSGAYFYRLTVDGKSYTKKLTLTK